MNIGENIRKIREIRGLTRDYMADEIEMSVSGYSKIERNDTDVTVSRLKKIADVLKIEIVQIFLFDENKILKQI